jgi:hypothetical protein
VRCNGAIGSDELGRRALPNPTTINLSWSASTDNIGVTNYLVFRDTLPSPIASVVGTAFSDTGLTPLSSHSYRVIASDGAGNLSGFSKHGDGQHARRYDSSECAKLI